MARTEGGDDKKHGDKLHSLIERTAPPKSEESADGDEEALLQDGDDGPTLLRDEDDDEALFQDDDDEDVLNDDVEIPHDVDESE